MEDDQEDVFPKVTKKNEIKKIDTQKSSAIAGITDSDVEYAKRAINECDTYEELLRLMGITSEDMERYTGNEKK